MLLLLRSVFPLQRRCAEVVNKSMDNSRLYAGMVKEKPGGTYKSAGRACSIAGRMEAI